jgi:hypothetical protein
MPYRVPPLRRAITKVPALDTVTGGSLPALLRQSIEGRNGPQARRSAAYSGCLGTMNAGDRWASYRAG